MLHTRVVVSSEAGLHMRAAAQVVRCAQRFQSDITLRFQGRAANARNILSVIALCAFMGATLDVEAQGEDAPDALRAIEAVFTSDGADPASAGRHL